MNVNEIINIIKTTAASQKGVHSVYDGDVYESWNSAEVKYGSVNVGLQNVTSNGNLVTYTLVLYYGDRLLQDKRNVNSVYSDGVRVLQSIINYMNENCPVDISETIIYTPFEQKFMDYLAGVYATVDILCESELGRCDIDEMEEDEPDPPTPPTPPEPVYSGLTLTSSGNSTVGLANLYAFQTIEYSMDAEEWTNMTTATTIELEDGEKVYIRGLLTQGVEISSSANTQFVITGSIAASGNMNYVWNYQNPNAALKIYCGANMFKNCTSLTSAPELPSTEAVQGCYYHMFQGCTSLVIPPELPARIQQQTAGGWDGDTEAYAYMFAGCTSLIRTPHLNSPTMCSRSYQGMFEGCTSLVTAYELPALTVADRAYQNMFAGCTSLVKAPDILATKLGVSILNGNPCTGMFSGCTNLEYVKCIATDKHSIPCTDNWLAGVSQTGVFVKDANTRWTTGASGIPTGWTVINAE